MSEGPSAIAQEKCLKPPGKQRILCASVFLCKNRKEDADRKGFIKKE